MHDIRYRIVSYHHAAAAYCLLVDGHDDRVRRNHLHLLVIVENPFLDDVLQLVRILAESLTHGFRVVLVVADDLLQHSRTYSHTLASARHILQTTP